MTPPQNSADRLSSAPDTFDTLVLFASLVVGFAIGNMPGLLGGFGLFWAVRIARQTPILPVTWRFFRNVFAGDKSTLDGIARVIFPAMQDDAPPENPPLPMGLCATVNVPPPVAVSAPATQVVIHQRGEWRAPQHKPQHLDGPTAGQVAAAAKETQP